MKLKYTVKNVHPHCSLVLDQYFFGNVERHCAERCYLGAFVLGSSVKATSHKLSTELLGHSGMKKDYFKSGCGAGRKKKSGYGVGRTKIN